MKQVQNMGFGNAHYFKDVASPKLDEIKQLLDNNSSSSKLEGMKRLIAMISKGKDVSSFFPDVVKNVICPSPEVKKLVYNYLIHYAEFQQDAALLSINTFQKDLDNSNQLIRAQALRILTSIRLKVIVQIQVLAVKKCVTDSSPYVRKTAAHAIPKVYHIDPSQKIELIECIETLLGDNTTLVLGSAIGAFNEVCPDRYDLLHGHYRKICGMLADFDEWGQVYTINTLTRYVRKHFVDPNPNSLKAKANGETKKKKGKGFYSDSESDESDEEDDYGSDLISEMDADHRTALRVTLPLLQSRNTAVTLAVASLFFYCAPHAEALRAGKALVRACRAHREIQFLLLQNIATMAVSRPELFAPYVSEFFIDETDPVIIRNTKLEILTCVATESNIARILRELTHYVHREEKEFVKCVIQAIVKCASRLEEVQDTCMHGLMSLISNPSDTVVAESVIAIKKLLQMGAGEDKRIVKNLVKLLDKIKVPSARASIIWCVGEYSSKIPKIAPDVLRKLAQTFSDEDAAVRMQILNLGCKLVLNNPHQTQFIFQYVINLAKYDVSYDIRDRARTLRSILTRPGSALLPFAKRLFSAEKPAPEDHFPYKERERWALGSISHSVGQTAAGYTEIPEWTTEVQGSDERNVVPKKQRKDFVGMGSDSIRFTPPPAARSTSSSSQTIDDFYGDNDRSRSRSRSRSYSRSRSGSYSRSRSGSYSRSRSRSRSRSGSYSRSRSRSRSYTPSQSRSRSRTPPRRGRGKYRSVSPSRSPSGSRSRSRSYSPPGSERDHSDDDRSPQKKGGDDLQSAFFGSPAASPGGQSLLEAFGGATLSSSPLLRPSSSDSIMGSLSSVSFGGGAELPREVLLKKVVGNGLQVEYQFQRSISIRGPSYLPVRIWVQNASDTAITSVVISSVSSIDGAELIPFDLIPIVHPGATVEVIANVKFASFSDGLKFKIEHSNGSFPVSITVPVGELLKPEPVSVATFADLQKKWGGLQESSLSVSLGPKSASKVLDRVLSAANVGVVEVTASSLKLSGRATLPSAEQILILVDLSGSPQVTSYVYSDNPILANNLNNAIASLLRN